jgi:hypothetical protein
MSAAITLAASVTKTPAANHFLRIACLSGQDRFDHVAEHRGRLFGAALVLEGELVEIEA